MKVSQKPFALTLAILFFTSVGFASKGPEKSKEEGAVSSKTEVEEYILHHIKDSHDFHLFSYTGSNGERKHFGFPLPVIVWSSKGLVSFMSSKFHHDDTGHHIVEAGGTRFVKLHSKIYELDEGADAVSFDESHHPTNAHTVFDMSITKSVFGVLLVGILMILWFGGLAKQYKSKKVPTGFGRILEPLVLYVRDEIARPNIGERKYRQFTGYLLTVFFFIWISNLLGLTPLGFNITGQIAITAALAIITLIIYTFKGNKDYYMHMLWMQDAPWWIRPILAIIELAGAFLIKPFSLLVRLFANISAGHIVVMSLIAILITMKSELTVFGSGLLSFVLSLFITLIELLVAFLQAYIFTMLSALFIGMAVAEHDHHHEHDEHGNEVPDAEDVRADFI